MNRESDSASILQRIKNCYCNIQLQTLHCISGNNPDEIPALIKNRGEIIALIENEERKLKNFQTTDATCKKIRDEIMSIISSIVLLDKQLEMIIKGSLANISHELSSLYQKSRAASAYTYQSRVKA
jgi:hypothetical protein